MSHDFRRLAREAARAADEKKGEGIVVLDLRALSDLADYVMIVAADSSAQMRAVEESVEQALQRSGARPLRREGRHAGRWIAIDYGSLLVHVMRPEAREFYRLEQMWDGAKRLSWNGKKRA